MAQSLNTKVDLVMKGTSYHGMNNYGNIMIGDKGFEYYNQRKLEDYIQIPWEEIDYVIASVIFRGLPFRRNEAVHFLLPQLIQRRCFGPSANMFLRNVWCAP